MVFCSYRLALVAYSNPYYFQVWLRAQSMRLSLFILKYLYFKFYNMFCVLPKYRLLTLYPLYTAMISIIAPCFFLLQSERPKM